MTLMQISTPQRNRPIGRIGFRLMAVLIVVGVVACSSEQTSGPDRLMPDLIKMYWADAEPQLRSLGWAGVLVKGPDLPADTADRNRILAQEPPAGQHLDADGAITLRFGS